MFVESRDRPPNEPAVIGNYSFDDIEMSCSLSGNLIYSKEICIRQYLNEIIETESLMTVFANMDSMFERVIWC